MNFKRGLRFRGAGAPIRLPDYKAEIQRNPPAAAQRARCGPGHSAITQTSEGGGLGRWIRRQASGRAALGAGVAARDRFWLLKASAAPRGGSMVTIHHPWRMTTVTVRRLPTLPPQLE